MAGQLTRNVTIAANESVNTLGAKLSQLVDLATFSGFSDDECGSTASIFRISAVAPTTTLGDLWSDITTGKTLSYAGSSTAAFASFTEGWHQEGGFARKNATGSVRVPGDCVGILSNFLAGDSTSPIGGVVSYSAASGSTVGLPTQLGIFAVDGIHMVRVGGPVGRGEFLAKNSASGNYMVISGGTTLSGSMGVALTSSASGGTISAILRMMT